VYILSYPYNAEGLKYLPNWKNNLFKKTKPQITMKHLLLILLLFPLGLGSCSQSKSETASTEKTKTEETPAPAVTIESRIKEYMDKNAHDPASYQPLNTILVDTVTYLSNLEKAVKETKKQVDFYSEYMKDYKDDLVKMKSDLKKYQHQMDSLKKSPAPNAIAALQFYHECRLKNQMGALAKTVYQVDTDAHLNILNVFDQSDQGKSLVYPGGFPKP
jgi:hypothetical protein